MRQGAVLVLAALLCVYVVFLLATFREMHAILEGQAAASGDAPVYTSTAARVPDTAARTFAKDLAHRLPTASISRASKSLFEFLSPARDAQRGRRYNPSRAASVNDVTSGPEEANALRHDTGNKPAVVQVQPAGKPGWGSFWNSATPQQLPVNSNALPTQQPTQQPIPTPAPAPVVVNGFGTPTTARPDAPSSVNSLIAGIGKPVRAAAPAPAPQPPVNRIVQPASPAPSPAVLPTNANAGAGAGAGASGANGAAVDSVKAIPGLGTVKQEYGFPYVLPSHDVQPIPFIPRKVTVYVSTGHFFSDYEGKTACKIGNVDLDCFYTSSGSAADTADGIWYHMPSAGGLRPSKPFQKHIGMSMESDVNYPQQKHTALMGQMDIKMSYRLDEDVPVLYPSWAEYEFKDPPLPFEQKSTEILATYIQSNCVGYRDKYVGELMRYIPVASFGKCLHNKEFPPNTAGGDWKTHKLTVLKQFKFALLFENSLTDYYVTERLFHAMHAGTVPVYMGAPQVDLYAPSNRSIIKVADFAGPKELAEYLLKVANDKELYESYLSWKRPEIGYSAQFKSVVDMSVYHSRCRLCVKLMHGCNSSCQCGKYPEVVVPYMQPATNS